MSAGAQADANKWGAIPSGAQLVAANSFGTKATDMRLESGPIQGERDLSHLALGSAQPEFACHQQDRNRCC